MTVLPVPFQFNRGATMSKPKAPRSFPTNLDEANELLARIREMQRAIATVHAERDAAIQRLETEFAPLRVAHDAARKAKQELADQKCETFERALDEYQDVLHAFAQQHRKMLLAGKSKTVFLQNGQFSWKFDGITVVVAAGEESRVIRHIKRKGKEWSQRFLRIVETLNRRNLGSEQPPIPGVRYIQKEAFIIQTYSDIPGGQEVFSPLKRSA